MFVTVHRPASPLDLLVETVTFFSGYMPPHQREKIIPDGAIQIIIDLHDRPKRKFETERGATGRSFARSWISGMQMSPVIIEAQQNASLLIIRFRPGGARPFLGFASEGLNGEVEPFEDVLDVAAVELRERVLEGATPAAKLQAVECWLRLRLQDCHAPPPVIAHLAALGDRPGLKVAQLADDLGYSTRQLRNIFHSWVGPGPKQFLQVNRFKQLIRQLCGSPEEEPDWAGLAFAHGYVDQSHLSHDFRRFADMSPGRFHATHAGLENFLPIHIPHESSAAKPLPIFARQDSRLSA